MPRNLENVKEEILQATRDMIVEKVYGRLNIRDIAKKCGIATGTFYNYFPSKQAVIAAVMQEDWRAFRQVVAEHSHEDKPPIEKLEILFGDLRQMLQSVHQIWQAGFPDDLESGTLNKLYSIRQQLHQDFAQHVCSLIAGHIAPEQEACAADIITRLFFSFAYEQSASFDQLRYFLLRMLD
ncbi:MAG: TetR/AcrR family transcriptional regulator [Christensenellaceae bacterium]|nr:TetR/AcrR family transcriptional regulator [Christensenellaceae bacterium]